MRQPPVRAYWVAALALALQFAYILVLGLGIKRNPDPDPPLAIRIELLVGYGLFTSLSFFFAIRLQRRSKTPGLAAFLIALLPFVLGEVSVPFVLLLKRLLPPLVATPFVAAAIIHAAAYVFMWRAVTPKPRQSQVTS